MFRKPLFVAAVMMGVIMDATFAPPLSARSGTYTVTTIADRNNAGCAVGDCSLREAIKAAKAEAGSEPATVVVPAGTYTLTLGQLQMTTGWVNINGAGSSSTIIDGNSAGRVFFLSATVNLTGLTIRNGTVTGDGGGIAMAGATVAFNDVILDGNDATGDGGGLYIQASSVYVNGLKVTNNTAGGNGGGIWNDFSVCCVPPDRPYVTENSGLQVIGNHADGNGGGLWNDLSGSFAVGDSLYQDNSAGGSGGGIYTDGTVSLIRATIADNTAAINGGGVALEGSFCCPGPSGAASQFKNFNNNLTISGNHAGVNGGGVHNAGGSVFLTYSTVVNNGADGAGGNFFNSNSGFIQFNSTIVANATDGGNCAMNSGFDTFTDSGFNLADADGASCGLTPGADPMLDDLLDNGGPFNLPTHAPTAGSPAIDAGDPAGCTFVVVDERQVARPVGAGCDIGAFEGVATNAGGLSLSLSPGTVLGTKKSTATVVLDAPAPAGGATITLASSNTDAATTPATIVINAGQTTKNFMVSTDAVAAPTDVTISASYAGGSANSILHVDPATPTRLTLHPTAVTGGEPSTATLTLSGDAPAGGLTIALAASNVAATVPVSATVQPGRNSVRFVVNTTAVAVQTMAIISASYNGITEQATLTVDAAELTKLEVSPATVPGGGSSVGTVTLNGDAPTGGAQVDLSSSLTAAGQVPANVTVLAGQRVATFLVTTSPVVADTFVTISATYAGVEKNERVKVTAPDVVSVSLNPTSVVGGNSSTGTVTLNGPAPAAGTIVILRSNTNKATVPASVTVPAGATSTTFTVNTVVVTSTASATITATAGGGSKSAKLTITR